VPLDKYPGLTEAIRLRYAKEGPEPLALKFGVSRATVCSRASRRGIKFVNRWKVIERTKLRNNPRLAERVRVVKDRYETEGPRTLAKELGVPVTRLYSMARERGLYYRNCWEEAFAEPLTSHAVYFLGLLWADGGIRWKETVPRCHSLAISLVESEWELLYALRDFLRVTGHIGKPYRKQENHKWARCFYLGNKRLVQSLLDRGIIPNKSNIKSVQPSGISDSLYGSFARGWIDGDGSVQRLPGKKVPELRWFGSHLAVETLQNTISRLCEVPKHKIQRERGCFRVAWGAKKDVEKIFRWLHADLGPYSRRKHNRYLTESESQTEPA